jgi:hypothetical protein
MGIKWEVPTLDIFSGNIAKDRKYWLEEMKAKSVKYFKLNEVKR